MSATLTHRRLDTSLPTLDGRFGIAGYVDAATGLEHLAVTLGEVRGDDPVILHIHHECLAGDIFGSTGCDCGRNTRLALAQIDAAGAGLLLYLRGAGSCPQRSKPPESTETVTSMLAELGTQNVHLLVRDDVPSLPGVRIGEIRPLEGGNPPAGLTRREVEVLQLIASGLLTKQIAERLAISRRTAYHHVEHIYSKIGASTRAAAAAFAVEHGLARSA